MSQPFLIRYMQPLIAGRRAECFELVNEAVRSEMPAEDLLCDVVWPAMAQIRRLYDDDRINAAIEHMACRINRTVADQLQAHLPKRPECGKRVLISSADAEGEELGAQMIADLFQASGWDVFFLGGGVPDDEVLSMVGQVRPQVYVIFGAHPEAVANTRALIERIRDVGVCPAMNVIVTGGIFNRADGLWQEIGADAFSNNPRGVLNTAGELGPRQPNAPRLGIVKKRRRRRKSTTPHAPTPA